MKYTAALLASVVAGMLAAELAADEAEAVPLGSTVVAAVDGAELHLKEMQTARLEKGTQLEVARVEGPWIGVYDRSTGVRRAGWIKRRDVAPLDETDLSPPPTADPQVQGALVALKRLRVAFETTHTGAVDSASARGLNITDGDLVYFKPLTELEELDLSDTKVSDDGLVHLAALAGLKRLYLSKTNITDAGLAHLASMTGLQVLALDNTKVLGPGLEDLRELTDLRALNLSHCAIEDEWLAPLVHFTRLETLALEKTKISGPALEYLKPMGNLHVLNLDGCEITDENAFSHLHGLEELRIIRMYGAKAPEKPLKALKRELRSLAIFR